MKSLLKGVFFYEVETCAGPLIDVYETGDNLVFEVDLPGVEASMVSVRVYEDLLIIEGMRVEDGEECGCGASRFLCMERGLRRFRRIVKIPIPANTQAGKAVCAQGVLTVTFPKLKGKLIKIAIERVEM